jgi:hypothetical protein
MYIRGAFRRCHVSSGLFLWDGFSGSLPPTYWASKMSPLSGLWPNSYMSFFSMCGTCVAYPIRSDLLILILYFEAYKLRNSWCNCSYPRVISPDNTHVHTHADGQTHVRDSFFSPLYWTLLHCSVPALFPWGKADGAWSWLLTPWSAEIKNEQSCTAIAPTLPFLLPKLFFTIVSLVLYNPPLHLSNSFIPSLLV